MDGVSLYGVLLAVSLSARRAWIEMLAIAGVRTGTYVALRKESVDRNRMVGTQSKLGKSRSPQGERG